ncbi:hypothetical protein B0J12DRAFT_693534 [Macrophomina phaseolina]|uniref:Uncharacterized protein n=1 Tax=Macrophomina phaseolina TaxID=35725 RepID=A0ABQ8GV77_9PEZI|nr:hypothetical protein B0J12DRAFT_693534 [Macrophomina phaseolina]
MSSSPITSLLSSRLPPLSASLAVRAPGVTSAHVASIILCKNAERGCRPAYRPISVRQCAEAWNVYCALCPREKTQAVLSATVSATAPIRDHAATQHQRPISKAISEQKVACLSPVILPARRKREKQKKRQGADAFQVKAAAT